MFKSKIFNILILGLFGFLAKAQGIDNPISADSFADLVTNIAKTILPIALTLAVVMIIYSGFLFVTAAGNEQKLTSAKTTFYWTLIGTAIVVLASVLPEAIKNALQGL